VESTTLPYIIPTTGTTVARGVSMTWGAWAEVQASVAEEIALAGCQFSGNMTNQTAEVQFGVGAAGAETAIGTLRVGCGLPSPTPSMLWYPFAVRISAGARLAVRIRVSSGSGASENVFPVYRAQPPGDVQTVTNPLLAAPTNTLGTSVSLPANWNAWGAWTQFAASIPNDWVLAAVSHVSNLFGNDLDIEIGVGAAGAEQAVVRWRTLQAASPGLHHGRFTFPVGPVAAGSRVAVRLRSTYGAASLNTSIQYYEGAL
jgi:hypothetical protein